MAIFVTKRIHAKPSSVPVNLCQKGSASNFSCPTGSQKYVKLLQPCRLEAGFGGWDSLTLGNAY